LSELYDIAIIGAGPAGCACALALHGSGLGVALIDRDTFPRSKICGDAIPALAFKAMDNIRPEWGQAMRKFSESNEIRTTKVFAPNGRSIVIDWVLSTYNSKRLNFDHFLLQLVRSETDAIIFENRKLEQVTAESDGVYCRFHDGSSLRAGIIIGCDGVNSVVRRELNKADIYKNTSGTAVRTYFQDIEGVKCNVNEFYFFKNFPGYLWIFPLENGCSNVGTGIIKGHNNKKHRAINLGKQLQTLITETPGLAERFKNARQLEEVKGFGLPLLTRKRPISGCRFMLCGDAASLVEPLMGHGIDHAMWSGLFAAKQAVLSFKSSDFTAGFMRQYDLMIYKKTGRGLIRKRFILKYLNYFIWSVSFFSLFGNSQKTIKRILAFLKI
jgi:geranylgeranyl reductase family protein